MRDCNCEKFSCEFHEGGTRTQYFEDTDKIAGMVENIVSECPTDDTTEEDFSLVSPQGHFSNWTD